MRREKHRPATTAGTFGVDGVIDPCILYRLDEVKARMGWRDAAFRAACRAGLKVHRSGKRGYLLGRDLIDFVTKGEVVWPTQK
jgi:hypothetical protein